MTTAAPAAAFLFAATTAFAGEPAGPSPDVGDARPGPNVLWISAEDISPDLGCYGDEYATTPRLDALAEEGVTFTRCFANAGVCAVARSCIITGMYPVAIGTQHMRSDVVPPPGVKCFPEYLRAAGYYTTNRSKTDYNFPAPPSAWDENGTDHRDWAGRAEGQPFFSVVNLTVSHESKVRDLGLRKKMDDLLGDDRHDPAEAPLPPYVPDTPEVRADRRNTRTSSRSWTGRSGRSWTGWRRTAWRTTPSSSSGGTTARACPAASGGCTTAGCGSR